MVSLLSEPRDMDDGDVGGRCEMCMGISALLSSSQWVLSSGCRCCC